MYSGAMLSLAYGLGMLTFVVGAGALLEILINKIRGMHERSNSRRK